MRLGVNGGGDTRTVTERATIPVAMLTQPRMLAACSVLLALLFTALGPRDGDLAALVVDYVAWCLQIGCGLMVLALVTLWLQRIGLGQLPLWVQLVASGVTGAIVFTPLALSLEWLLQYLGMVQNSDAAQSLSYDSIFRALGEEFVGLLPPFVSSWLLINLSYLGIQTAPLADKADPDDLPAQSGSGSLKALLKPALGQEIVYLKADLNYVHVFTTRGQTMVLYSLARAAEELGDQGLLVHRSYWVAKAAVQQVRRTGGQMELTLRDGSRVPVSRRRQRLVLEEFGSDYRATP